MLKRYSSYCMAAVLAGILYVPFSPFVQADYSLPAMPPIQQVGNITYMSGGIGDEEREAMRSVRKNYDLTVMSAADTGAFVGDTRITILDRQGQQLLSADAGPMFYVRLPAGRYVVEGSADGQIRRTTVNVAADHPAHILFSWR